MLSLQGTSAGVNTNGRTRSRHRCLYRISRECRRLALWIHREMFILETLRDTFSLFHLNLFGRRI